MIFPSSCPVCGSNQFSAHNALWPGLISEWQLLPDEVDYINRQQGLRCNHCSSNFRSMALADAILHSYRFHGTLHDFVHTQKARSLRVLEINSAGGLTATLSLLPLHIFARYPQFDMTNLTFETGSFDLVLHSDTLEHIKNPCVGLSECRRVLDNSGGRCIFTVPIVVGRLSRSREGLAISSHAIVDELDDCTVISEFGVDIWRYVMEAGFTSVRMHAFEFPAALAIEASNRA